MESRYLPKYLIIYQLCLAYAIQHPLILFFGLLYFSLGYMVMKHQLLMVYTKICESGGCVWHGIFRCIVISLAISQCTLIGVVASKQGIQMGQSIYIYIYIPNSNITPLFCKMAQNLDLRCVLYRIPAAWVLGPKHVSTRPRL